jgi:hypothetical protein
VGGVREGGEASWGGRHAVGLAHGVLVVAAWAQGPRARVQAQVQLGQVPAASRLVVEGVGEVEVVVVVDWAWVQEECLAACWLGAAGRRKGTQCSSNSSRQELVSTDVACACLRMQIRRVHTQGCACRL